jgi:hypothetical protein
LPDERSPAESVEDSQGPPRDCVCERTREGRHDRKEHRMRISGATNQRSTSPMTGSSEAIVATVSATSESAIMIGSACRL